MTEEIDKSMADKNPVPLKPKEESKELSSKVSLYKKDED